MAGLWRTKYFGLRYGAAFGALFPPAGDTTAPTITTSGSFSINENTALAIALTADEAVTWSISGGPDAAKYEISGTTLRFAGDATKNFEAPDDADTNNTYIVTVRATDAASNFTDKGITVTILNLDESGVDPTIGVPVLSLAVPAGTYPPQLNTPLPVDWQADVTSVRLQAATVSNADAGWGTTSIDNLHLITNAEALAGAWTVTGLSGITTPAVTVFRARAEQGGNVGAWSNELIHGDVTAPSLTSSTAPAAISELVDSLVYTATFNEKVTITGFGGTDAALLEADNPTVPATTFAIRRLDHAVTNYATKSSYSFTIIAKDRADNSTTTATITAAVKDEVPTGFVNFFTDQTGVTASTLATAAETYTVAGLTSGVTQPITISGGEYRVDAGGGYGAWTSAAGVVQNTHLVQVRGTSSGTSGGVVNVILTIAGTSETFKITTAGTAPLPSGAVFQFDANDLTTLFQDVAGSTAVTTTGQTVGKWNDKSGNARHVAAAADNATRPIYDLTSGVHSVVGSAVNSTVLIGTNPSGMWQAGAWSLVFAVKANAGTGQAVMADGSSSSTFPLAAYARSNGSTASTMSNSFRDSATGTINLTDPTVALKTAVFDNNYRVVVLIDDGSGFTVWYDGVKQSKITTGYNRGGGSITGLDRMSLFARIRPTIDSYLTGQLQHVSGFARALSDADASQASSYAGSLQGRTI